jgi:hypothetical protein
MEITCPECKKATAVQIAEGLCCQHCQTSFEKLKFAKKALITTTSALTLGTVIGFNADDFFEPNRYPLRIEYALVEACSNGKPSVDYYRRAGQRFEVCACALKTVQEDISYKQYKKAPIAFVGAMESAAKECAE